MIAFIRSRAPSALVTPEALARLEILANRLPDAMSSYYLECRLAANFEQVDLMGCVSAADGGRELLRSHLLRDERFHVHPVWSAVARFCAAWSEPGTVLFDLVPHVWLAFDVDESYSWERGPCILLCLDPKYPDGTARLQQFDQIKTLQTRLFTDPAFVSWLKECGRLLTSRLVSFHDLLPSSAQLLHLSLMLSRSPQLWKLNILLPKVELLPYLSRISYGRFDLGVCGVLSQFAGEREWIKFQIVVNENVAPALEIELHFDESNSFQQQYRGVLDRLCQANLCSQEKKEALRSWPGRVRVAGPGKQWPTRWTTWTDIKIAYQPEYLTSVKAYLGFMPSSSVL